MCGSYLALLGGLGTLVGTEHLCPLPYLDEMYHCSPYTSNYGIMAAGPSPALFVNRADQQNEET